MYDISSLEILMYTRKFRNQRTHNESRSLSVIKLLRFRRVASLSSASGTVFVRSFLSGPVDRKSLRQNCTTLMNKQLRWIIRAF